nr:Gag-Pol polyprotein [Tanacetum cinerariifolium]
PKNKELEILFQLMFDENLKPLRFERPASPATVVQVPIILVGTPSSTTIDQDAPFLSHLPSSSELQPPISHQGVATGSTIIEDNPFSTTDNDPFINVFAPEPSFEASSSEDSSSAEFIHVTQPRHHLEKWSKDHPLENIIGNLSRLISTRKQLATNALWCLYNSVLEKVEPKNFKSAVTEDCWFQAMQDKIHEFDRIQVWELVPRPYCVMIIALKWIYKVKLDEYGDVLKTRLGWWPRDIDKRRDKKPDLTFLQVFGALCYHTNDSEDLEKLKSTTDIRIFVGYAPSRKGYRIYNKRTRRIMETIHVQLDELSELMASMQLGIGSAPMFLMPKQISSWLVPNLVLAAPYVPPKNKELEILFQLMFDENLKPLRFERPASPATTVQVPIISVGTPSSTTIDQDAPFLSHLPSSLELQPPISHQGVATGSTIIEDNPFSTANNDPFINVFAPEPSFEASSSEDISSAEFIHITQPRHHLEKWSKDHPFENIIGNLSRLISTRKQLATNALWCLYNSVLEKIEPKNFKSAVTEDCWFQAMQDKIHEFDRLQVWELVPRPDCVMIIALKWIYKVKLD